MTIHSLYRKIDEIVIILLVDSMFFGPCPLLRLQVNKNKTLLYDHKCSTNLFIYISTNITQSLNGKGRLTITDGLSYYITFIHIHLRLSK